MQNHTLGTNLASTNFVSFSYSSNLLSFSLSSANAPNLYGVLPSSLPAAADFNVYGTTGGAGQTGMELFTSAGGGWCAGFQCAADTGTAGTWSRVSSTTPTPAPASLCLALTGCLALSLFARWSRRRQRA